MVAAAAPAWRYGHPLCEEGLPLRHACVKAWCESMLAGPATVVGGEGCAWIPLGRVPAAEEVAGLAGLIARAEAWRGVRSVRRMEERGRRHGCGRVRPVGPADGPACLSQGLVLLLGRGEAASLCYDVGGDVFCVDGPRLVLFESQAHLWLFLSLASASLTRRLYGALWASLRVGEDDGPLSEVRHLSFEETSAQTVDRWLHSAALWRGWAAWLWPGAELRSLGGWDSERSGSTLSIESSLYRIMVLGDALRCARLFIVVERDAMGRHARCLFVLVRHDCVRRTGSVLMVSYIGTEARRRLA